MKSRVLTVGVAAALATAPAFAQPNAPDPAAAVRRDHWRLVQIDVTDPAHFGLMGRFGAEFIGCEPRPGPAEFIVPPGAMPALSASGLTFKVLATDVQAGIDRQNAEINRLRGRGHDGGPAAASWYDVYRDLAEIEAHLDELIAMRPDLAHKLALGQTGEGREIFGVRLNGLVDPGHCKPILLLNSCQHAREWMTPMVNMYNAEQLITGYGSDPYLTGLLDTVEFVIVPVTNPDGYNHAWTVDNMWRKNRRDNGGGSFGVDNNRNWGYEWGLTLPGGAGGNDNPDSNVYWGIAPFSEPENQALRDFALAHPQIRSHNDIHSTGNLILQPWGHTPDLPPDHAVLDALGAQMHARVAAVHGANYVHGPIYTHIYPVSGSAVDWFYGDRGAMSFTYELRGPGFQPPPSEIILGCEETFPATMYQAEFIAVTYQFRADWNRDCVYDLFDFLAFINDFEAGSPDADFDGDGTLDLFDFLTFLNAFDAGE
jgi:murein tripeptide amidase MpaA